MGEATGNMGYEMGSQKDIQAARERVALEQLRNKNKPVEKKPDPLAEMIARQLREQQAAIQAKRAKEVSPAVPTAPVRAELPRVIPPPPKEAGRVWARTEREILEVPEAPAADYQADAVVSIDQELKKPGVTPELLRIKLERKWRGLAENVNAIATAKAEGGMTAELNQVFGDVLEQQTTISAQLDELDRRFPPGKKVEKPKGAAIGLAAGGHVAESALSGVDLAKKEVQVEWKEKAFDQSAQEEGLREQAKVIVDRELKRTSPEVLRERLRFQLEELENEPELTDEERAKVEAKEQVEKKEIAELRDRVAQIQTSLGKIDQMPISDDDKTKMRKKLSGELTTLDSRLAGLQMGFFAANSEGAKRMLQAQLEEVERRI